MTDYYKKTIKDSVEHFISAVCRDVDAVSNELYQVIEAINKRLEVLKSRERLPTEYENDESETIWIYQFLDYINDYGFLYETVTELYKGIGIE